MYKKLSMILVISVMPIVVNAMQCPNVIAGLTFQHPVINNAPGQQWLMDVNYINQGWNIVQDPLNQNAPYGTIENNAALKVIYMRSTIAPNAYAVACEYTISPEAHIKLILTNSNFSPAPTNSNFKKLSNTTFVCNTSANNSSMCSDNTVREIVCGLGRSC